MKRIFSIILAALLLVCLGASAFASSDPGAGNNEEVTESVGGEVPVQGTYKLLEESETIYVSMTWSGMSFTYTPEHKGDWDPKNHEYKKNVEAKWESSDNKGYGTISFSNHSDPSVIDTIQVTLTFEKNPLITGTVRMKFSETTDVASKTSGLSYSIALDANTGRSGTIPKDVYVLPAVGGTVSEFPGNSLGTIKVTIAREIMHDPGLPGPGIESVQPAPEAGEIAANG